MACQAVKERSDVTIALASVMGPAYEALIADDPALGSEALMLRVFSVARGVVNEYQDGGDQVVENCTCTYHYWEA